MEEALLVGTDLQLQTLRLYGELMCRRASWAGKLVFARGAGASASGLAAAVSIAGGTTLVVDPDTAMVKAVFRQGGVDFLVNTLDEALRVLKNEIRRGRPLGVGLVAEVGLVLEEMVERGVVPDLEVSVGGEAEELLGREGLRLASREGIVVESEWLVAWLAERGWSEAVLEGATSPGLREVDARLLELLPDALRKTWVQRIGHYQRAVGGGTRVVWLTAGELVALG